MRTDNGVVERHLSELASEISGHEVGPDEPLGLDSLQRAEIAFALEERLGVRFPGNLAFGTLAEAAAGIEELPGRSASERPALEKGTGHLHWLGKAVSGAPLRTYYRMEVFGRENVPGSGPAVLAMNHDSLLDIPILVAAIPRTVWFMAKQELFSRPFKSWFFHVLGGFPVSRGGYDLKGIRSALEVVKRGRLLGMYPEGTRTRGLGPFLPGAAWVALSTGAQIIPTALKGTGESMASGAILPRRTRVIVRFGEPMEPGIEGSPKRRIKRAREVTAELRAAVEQLLAG
ncbi:MAG: 1-acyl-sn-glycerol-3-phosphate acyltransferase [Actinomycetota bacterium]